MKNAIFADLDEAAAEAALEVRKELAQAIERGVVLQDNSFLCSILISGRILDGDLKLEIKLGRSVYGVDEVKGGKLEDVVRQFIQRTCWNNQHAPLMLGAPESEAEEVGEKSEETQL